MASYVIAGASRGLGYAFVKELAVNQKNTVIGLVRDKDTKEKQVTADGLAGKNVTIMKADMTDRPANEAAAEATAKLTGGGLDYLIVNGAYISHDCQFMTMDDFANQPDFLESQLDTHFKVNVAGVIKTINAFMPLIRKGNVKKVVVISSLAGDSDMINRFDFDTSGPYAMSKSAVNTAVALFSSIYKKEDILFLAMAPGVVDTGHAERFTAEQREKAQRMFGTFLKMKPDFRQLSPEESARMCLDVTNKASIENGDGGRFLSQNGNKEWL